MRLSLKRGRWLLLLIAISFTLPSFAQEAVTPTPIPVEDVDSEGNTGLGLPTNVPANTQSQPAAANDTSDAPAATDSDTCPTLVQEGFTATEFVCESITSGQACIGNGTVQSQVRVAETSFAQPGDIAPFTALDQFSLDSVGTANNVWSVVTGTISLDSASSGPVDATTVYFGDVSISDAGTTSDEFVVTGGTRTAQVLAERGLNVRRTPENAGVVVWQLGAGDRVNVTGITPDDVWLRVTIPNRFSGTGWVYAPYMEVEGGSDTLPTVTTNSPEPVSEEDSTESEPERSFGPMQAIQLRTEPTPEGCGVDVPPSGLLMQSPSGLPDAVVMQINGTELALNGAVFVQAVADSALIYDVLEGTADVTVNGSDTSATVGQRIRIPIDSAGVVSGEATVESISLAGFTALPTRLLPRQFVLEDFDGADPVNEIVTGGNDAVLTEAAPAPATGGGFATPTPGGGFIAPTQAPTQIAQTCTLTATNVNPNIRGGPGTEYPVVGNLQADSSAQVTGRNTDTFNITWYQIANGWLRFDTVTTQGDCTSVPLVDAPPVPTTPTPTAAPEQVQGPSLTSTVLGDVCAQGQTSVAATSDGSQLSLQLGGVFTVTNGTAITISTQGGQLRPEFGDYIQIQREDGTELLGSGEGRVLALTFDTGGSFILRFSAANGDTVSMNVQCNT